MKFRLANHTELHCIPQVTHCILAAQHAKDKGRRADQARARQEVSKYGVVDLLFTYDGVVPAHWQLPEPPRDQYRERSELGSFGPGRFRVLMMKSLPVLILGFVVAASGGCGPGAEKLVPEYCYPLGLDVRGRRK